MPDNIPHAHCPTCAQYPQAYRLGYAEALEGWIEDVGNTPDVPPDVEDESQWWLAYWHGKSAGRRAKGDAHV